MSSAYTAEQIDRYLDYVSIPQRYREQAKTSKRDIVFLTALHVHQISAIPYENLSLHYAKERKVILEPQKLYQKLTRNGRGGYCMEVSIFFNQVLRALGFRAYLAGVRIRRRVDGIPSGPYVGW
jgi:arylamine N-acetyltransferase